MSGGPSTSVPEGGNVQWSRQDTAWIIDMYRQKPCLWNIKSADYKDRNKRVTALTAITREIEKKYASVTIADIKKKLDCLRNQYRREMRQMENSRKSGAGTDDVYSPKLWCFDELSFLNDGGRVRVKLNHEPVFDTTHQFTTLPASLFPVKE
ncbi:uncharacterized protein LOC123516724 [Portunus trituberculatus]|uniref:uncharacterized protein LOC123516724 n=1 Tax=Portunus trituberculatus TaxID=210409 RepID=UPI001E1CBCC0|nr:uncharacterized protein LOC123516724 [Portunus trituberculatus]